MESTDATSIQYRNIKPEDMKDYCRVCMGRNNEMNQIFDTKSDSIVDRVQFCTGVEFSKDDGLPTIICTSCLQNLTVAHEFKTTCLRSNEAFHKILLNNIKKEHDNDLDDIFCYDVDDDDDETKVKYEFLDDFKLDAKLKVGALKENIRTIKQETNESIETKLTKPKKPRGPYKKSGKPKKPRKLRKLKFRRLHCMPCDIKFATKLESEEHKKTVHKDESWVCEICGKMFIHRASHYTHMRSHLPPSYGCEQCDYKTWHKHDLVKHIRIHTGVKLYQCEFCTASYCTSSNLTSHIKRFHQRIKPFKCEQCDRRFYDRTKLNRHIDSHNDIKRFECDVCHSFFTRRCYWKKHLHRQHGVIVPPQRPGRQKLNCQVGEVSGNNSVISRLNAVDRTRKNKILESEAS